MLLWRRAGSPVRWAGSRGPRTGDPDLRVGEPSSGRDTGASLFVFAFVYLALAVAFLLFAAVIMERGPGYRGPGGNR